MDITEIFRKISIRVYIINLINHNFPDISVRMSIAYKNDLGSVKNNSIILCKLYLELIISQYFQNNILHL